MSEYKKQVKVFETYYICDECEKLTTPHGDIVLKSTGDILMTIPAK